MSLVNLTDSAKNHLKKLTQDNNKKYVRLEVKGVVVQVLDMTGHLITTYRTVMTL